MSHFLGLVFVDKNAADNDLSEPVEKMLAPYDENAEVAPYVKYSKEIALQKAQEDFRDRFNSLTVKKNEFLKKCDNWQYTPDSDNLEDFLTGEEYAILMHGPDLTTNEAIAYLKDNISDFGFSLDEDLNITTTYNPKSKWDWYAYGGRYLDYLPYPDGKDGGKINFVGEIDWNRILMAEEDYLNMDGGNVHEFKGLPCVFIDKEGNWNQRGEVGWWGTMDEEMTIDEWREYIKKYVESLDEKDIVVVVDFHI